MAFADKMLGVVVIGEQDICYAYLSKQELLVQIVNLVVIIGHIPQMLIFPVQLVLCQDNVFCDKI